MSTHVLILVLLSSSVLHAADVFSRDRYNQLKSEAKDKRKYAYVEFPNRTDLTHYVLVQFADTDKVAYIAEFTKLKLLFEDNIDVTDGFIVRLRTENGVAYKPEMSCANISSYSVLTGSIELKPQ